MTALGHLESLPFFAGPIVLAAGTLLVILCDLIWPRRKVLAAAVSVLACAGALVVTAMALRTYPRPPFWSPAFGGSAPEAPARLFMGAAAYDGFALFFHLAFLIAALLVAVFSWPVVRKWEDGQGEYYTMVLSLTFGMFVMAMAQTLLLMYLAIEFSSVVAFILAGMLRGDRRSAEAALKYIIYSASASGVMLFGMSLWYGMAGTLDVTEIGRAAQGLPVPTLVVAAVLSMGGFAYKIAAVPFHLWCPDVYEGAPTPAAAFFSVGPKAAGLAILARFLAGVFPAGGPDAWVIAISAVAILTMALGNCAALWQSNLKRLMAYSSIAHAGYILLAYVTLRESNLAAVAFYALAYVVMNLGAFFVVIVLEETYGITTVEGCRGIGWRVWPLGAAMTIFLLSLTGIPPTAGFVAKFMLFGSVLKEGGALGTVLVVLGVLFSVVSLGYYARVFGAMYLAKPQGEFRAAAPPWVQTAVLALLAAGVIGLQVAFGPVWAAAEQAGARFLGI